MLIICKDLQGHLNHFPPSFANAFAPADPLFGSSKHLGIGPVAVTSQLLGSGLAGIVPGADSIKDSNVDSPEQTLYNQYATQVAFIVAIMYTGTFCHLQETAYSLDLVLVTC